MDDVHPHDPPTRDAAKLLGQKFHQLMDRQLPHVRVDYNDDRLYVKQVGTARELHGPQGVCSCCVRRPKLTVDGDPVG